MTNGSGAVSGGGGASPRSSATGASLMARLRERTSEHHARAEGKVLQQRMLKGQLSRDEYTAWLSQLLLVHKALEAAAATAASREDGAVLSVVSPLHHHSTRIVKDLSFYKAPGETFACASTARIVSEIEAAAASSAFEVLGMYYVLEGSMNGNAYIARAVARGFGLTGSEGLAYLNPYAERQREVWAEFKAGVDAVPATEAQMLAAERAAQRMFDAVAEISDELAGISPRG